MTGSDFSPLYPWTSRVEVILPEPVEDQEAFADGIFDHLRGRGTAFHSQGDTWFELMFTIEAATKEEATEAGITLVAEALGTLAGQSTINCRSVELELDPTDEGFGMDSN